MAAGAHKQYTAVFAIGAKMLGSFRGVMASAQARMKGLHAASMRMASGLWRFVSRLGGLLTIFAGFAAGKILSSIFGDAAEQAAELEQRMRRLTITLLQHGEIRKKGMDFAKRQTELIFQQAKAVSELGVMGQDQLETAATQMAVYGFGPKKIAALLGPMADVLVASKGVTATQEDAAALADAWGKAIKGGMTKGLRQFGFVLSDTQQKEFKGLKSAEARNKWISSWAEGYKGVNKAAMETPLGRIQRFHNEVKEFSEDIGFKVLPAQAAMADAWRAALPELKPVAVNIFKGVMRGATAFAGYVRGTLLPAFRRFGSFVSSERFQAAWARLTKAFKDMGGELGRAFLRMLGLVQTKGRDLTSTVGDKLIQALDLLAKAMKFVGENAHIVAPLVVALTASMIALNVAMSAASVLNPLSLAVIGITAAAVGLYELNRNWQDLEDRRDSIGEVARALHALQGVFDDKFLGSADAAREAIKKVYDYLAPITNKIWDLTKALNAGLVNALTKVFNVLIKLMSPLERLTGFKMPVFKPPDLAEAPDMARLRAQLIPSPAQVAAERIPKYQEGGIIQRASLGVVGEAGPEAIIPLSRAPRARGLLNYANQVMGSPRETTNVSFAPQITINGSATEQEQQALDTRLRSLAKDFITQFKAAQQQERRLSYESGYA